jgi:transposase
VDCWDLNPLRSCVTSRWRAIRKDLPPASTINCYFSRCQHDGTLKRVYHPLPVFCLESAVGEASPTAGSAGTYFFWTQTGSAAKVWICNSGMAKGCSPASTSGIRGVRFIGP